MVRISKASRFQKIRSRWCKKVDHLTRLHHLKTVYDIRVVSILLPNKLVLPWR
jgi:hypothetical protein